MPEGTHSYVGKISEAQADFLKSLLQDRGWEISQVPYSRWKASSEHVNVVAYESGKLVVQGKGTTDFVEFILEPEVLHTFGTIHPEVSEEAEEDYRPHGGVDESGKGDFFGPLCVAGVYVDGETGPALRKLGVCDSKLIKSSSKILALAEKIRQESRGKFTTVVIGPEAYNRIYRKFGNLNSLLAWGHARVIENLLEKVPDCPRMLSDKFGAEYLIRRALQTRGKQIVMEQSVRAESNVAVAAASILAREQFLRGMDRLSKELGVELVRGAGPKVLETGRELQTKFGAEIFSRCAKIHFKTYGVLTGIHEND